MRRKTETTKPLAEKVVKDTRRRTRKRHSAEESERANAIGPRETANADRAGGSSRRGAHCRAAPQHRHGTRRAGRGRSDAFTVIG
jgi:hypothetical protein